MRSDPGCSEVRPRYKGLIAIDFDPWWTEDCGAAKLSITDNGIGMTGAQLQQYMNTLSSSGRTQAIDANFGVGAKIASLSYNPHGVVFESWKEDAGNMIHIWKDPAEGNYGLRPIPDGEGNEYYVARLADSPRPSGVVRHGTRVVLLGMSKDDNTCEPPEMSPRNRNG
jgi:hypothetical protein